MSLNPDNVLIGLILILPGLYLFWYANEHPAFFEERRWEKWGIWGGADSAFAGAIFELVHRLGGPSAVRRSFKIIAIICLGVGLWAVVSP
jgi:hypothetical protein